jgi:hypothetical protein
MTGTSAFVVICERSKAEDLGAERQADVELGFQVDEAKNIMSAQASVIKAL